MFYDRMFDATPLWVGYHIDKKQLEIIFDDGTTFPIEWTVTDDIQNYLMRINKIPIIKMRGGKPAEGFDTRFFQIRNGKAIIDE